MKVFFPPRLVDVDENAGDYSDQPDAAVEK